MTVSPTKFLTTVSTYGLIVLLVCIVTMTASVDAQTRSKVSSLAGESTLLAPNPSADLGQCRNGAPGAEVDCVELTGGAAGWVNGNAGTSNSHYSEDDFIAYRMVFDNLSTTGTHEVILGYDIFHNGKHAIDYLGSFDATETTADPCSGTNLACDVNSPTSFLTIDPDTFTVTNQINPYTGLPVVQEPGEFTMWGGQLLTFEYLPYTAGDVERRVKITFTASVPNPVLAWGGHIAWRGDWGAGMSAGGVSGSPYHMRLKDLDGQGGNQDRSLTVAAPRGVVVIVKEFEDADDASPFAYTFTSTSSLFNPLVFQLTDDNEGPGVAVKQSLPISGTSSFMVSETVTANSTLLSINCVEVGGVLNSGQAGTSYTANINVELGESVVCTFTNGVGGSTSGDGSVSGRVVNSYGIGISNARLSLVNASSGETVTVLTNGFGHYTIDDIAVGEFYMLNVSHKRYRFAESTKILSLIDSIANVDFVANP